MGLPSNSLDAGEDAHKDALTFMKKVPLVQTHEVKDESTGETEWKVKLSQSHTQQNWDAKGNPYRENRPVPRTGENADGTTVAELKLPYRLNEFDNHLLLHLLGVIKARKRHHDILKKMKKYRGELDDFTGRLERSQKKLATFKAHKHQFFTTPRQVVVE